MITGKHDRSLTDIVRDLVDQVAALIRAEGLLARTELGEQINKILGAVLTSVTGAAILPPGIFIVLVGIVALLIRAGVPDYAAALVVGLGVVLVGGILLMSGVRRLKTASFFPTKTFQQLHRDIAVVKHVRQTDDQRAA